MSIETETMPTRVSVVCHVPLNRRASVTPKMFGAWYLAGESAVYETTRKNCPDYTGGSWHYVELSNGGYFMFPDMVEQMLSYRVASNGWSGVLSPEAAGIVSCLLVLSALACQLFERGMNNAVVVESYHKLRDYALDHKERSSIFGAID